MITMKRTISYWQLKRNKYLKTHQHKTKGKPKEFKVPEFDNDVTLDDVFDKIIKSKE